MIELKKMDDDPTKYWTVVDGRKTGWGTYHTEREMEILDAMDRYVLTGEKPEELKFEDLPDSDTEPVGWIGLDEQGNWDSAEKIEKHWKVKPTKMIYTETRIVDVKTMRTIREEEIYKDMLISMISSVPMYKLKEIFPLEIIDQQEPTGPIAYKFRIRKEI